MQVINLEGHQFYKYNSGEFVDINFGEADQTIFVPVFNDAPRNPYLNKYIGSEAEASDYIREVKAESKRREQIREIEKILR